MAAINEPGPPVIRDSDATIKAWERRIGTLEDDHHEFRVDLSRLNKIAGTLEHAVNSLTDSLSAVSDIQTNSLKTNWSVVVGTIGVILVIAGLVIYKPLEDIDTLLRSHLFDGHPDSVLVKLGGNEKRLVDHFDINRAQLARIESRLDMVDVEVSSIKSGTDERLWAIERTLYNASRPTLSKQQKK